MKSPAVSVVIPVYRSEGLLEQTLESVLNQTFQDFEIILVDNNASSGTRAIADFYRKRFPDLIRLIREPEQGVCSARNTGIRESLGTYVALLDDDDMMAPKRLEKQLKAAIEHPDASMITCGADFIDHSTGKVIYQNVIGAPLKWAILEGYLRDLLTQVAPSGNSDSFVFAYPSTMFFSRQKAIEAGLFDLRLNPNFGEDYEFSVRMFGRGTFVTIPEPLAIYRFNAPASIGVRKNPEKLRFLYLQGHKFFFVLWENIGQKNPNTKPVFQKIAAFHLQLAGRHFLRYEYGTKIGKALLMRAWKNSPLNLELFKDALKSRFPKRLLPRLFWFDHQFADPLPPGIDRHFEESLFSTPPEWIP